MCCLEGDTNHPSLPDDHQHFYIQTPLKIPAIRARLRKLGLFGNTSFSCKTLTKYTEQDSIPMEYVAYMTKEKNFYHNLPEDLVEQAIEHNNNIQESIKARKQAKKSRLEQLADYCSEELVVQHPFENNPEYEEIPLPPLVSRIVDFYLENNCPLNSNMIKNYAETLIVQRLPSARKTYIDAILADANITC